MTRIQPGAHAAFIVRAAFALIAVWWLWRLASSEAFEVMEVVRIEYAAVPEATKKTFARGLLLMNEAAQRVLAAIDAFYAPASAAAPGEDVFVRILNAVVPAEFLAGRVRVLHALTVLFWVRLHAAGNIALLWLMASAAWWFDGWSMRSVTAARFLRVLPTVSAASLSAGCVLPWLAAALLFVPQQWAPSAALAAGSLASVAIGLWLRTYHKPASGD